MYKKSIQRDLANYIETITDKGIKTYLYSNLKMGIGKPTTCTYQFLHHTDEYHNSEVYQYFIYDGLKIVLRIHDFACKTFYGHMATHRTAMPLLVRNNKVFYTDKDIGVFAWGKS